MDDLVERVLAMFAPTAEGNPYQTACEIATNLVDMIRKGERVEAIAQEVARQMGSSATAETVRRAVEDVVGVHATKGYEVPVLPNFAEMLSWIKQPDGYPRMAESFRLWGEDVQNDVERVWPRIAEAAMVNHAVTLFRDMENARSEIERKLYIALHARYAKDLVLRPSTNVLRLNCTVSWASDSLRRNDQHLVFRQGGVDYEIDLFLCLEHDVREFDGQRVRRPFFVAIECDGHEFHSTRDQIENDRLKEHELGAAGLRVIRFTGSGITQDVEQCVGVIESHFAAHVRLWQR